MIKKYILSLPDGQYAQNAVQDLMNTVVVAVNTNVIVKKEYYVRPTCLSSVNVSFYANQFGKTVFLTREEAEKKLEEMKKNE